MSQVYAKFFSRAGLVGLVLFLSACAGDGGYRLPWPHAPEAAVEAPSSPAPVTPVAEGKGAAAQPQPVPASELRRVTVALLVPLSGKGASLGNAMLKAAQMALFDIGAANVELVPHDTKGTPAGAVEAAQAAAHERVDLVLGPVFAEDVKAVQGVAGLSSTPLIAFTTDWTLASDTTYIMGFLPFTQVTRAARYADRHGHKTFAILAPRTDYGDATFASLQKSGVTIAHTVRYPSRGAEFKKLAAELASGGTADFDALFVPAGSEALRSIAVALNEAGIKPPAVRLIGTGLWDDPKLAADPVLAGGWFAAPDPNARADFEKRYRASYGETPQRLSTLAYDATALAAVLAYGARSGESPYTRAALTNPRGFSGIDGIFRFRSDGLSERGLAVLEIRNGTLKVMDPAPASFEADR